MIERSNSARLHSGMLRRLTPSWIFAACALAALGAGTGAGPQDLSLSDTPPLLRHWEPPVYPPALLKAKVAGSVEVRMVVDPLGEVTLAHVIETTDPRFNDAAVAAVKIWTFIPGVEDGHPNEYCLDVTVSFSPDAKKKGQAMLLPDLAFQPRLAPRTEIEPLKTPAGDYPEILTTRKIGGAVTFAGVISAQGRVVSPRITGASQVEFVLPALESLKTWEFKPATQGDLNVKSTLEGKVTFDAIGDNRDDILAANHITAPDGTVPPIPPEPYLAPDAVFPFDLLLKGEGGSASVEFLVKENGFTEGMKVREASKPEFGHALAAAIEAWVFQPAINGGRAVSVPLMMRWEFKPVIVGQESATDPLQRLVAAARAGAIGTATKLDEKLTPILRVPPVYPLAFMAEANRPAGNALIEFVIDRDGRCRLPRVVSATREEFGWSAATAVAQWVFKAPLREGISVDVVMKIPFEFTAPER